MSDPKTLTPEQRIKELEQQLELMSQKDQFFETVVDVLKNDYGVSVVKAIRQVLSQGQVAGLSIARACQFLGMSRQAYYKRNRAADSKARQADRVVEFVQQIRIRQPRLGTRKLHYLLHCQPDRRLQIGRDRLFQVLGERRLLVLPKRAYHKTTQSFHLLPPSEPTQVRPEPGCPVRTGARLGGGHYLPASQ